MKPQAAGLVLCALLISTFGHDVLNRYQAAHPSGESRQVAAEKAVLLHAPTQDTYSSGFRNTENILLINSTTNLVAILNETARVALVFDINNCYSAIYCGDTGNVYVINLDTKVGVFIPGNSSRRGWIARTESFEVFFKRLSSLESVYEDCENSGETFQIGNVSSRISLGIKVATLAVNRGELFETRARALQIFITYTDTFVKTLRGPLNGILKILGSGTTTLHIGTRSLIVIFHTLGEIVCKVKGGVTILADLCLDWNIILNSKSWSRTFMYLFSKLGEHNVDEKSIIRDYSDNISILFAGLAGNSTEGNNGASRITAEIKSFILGKRAADSLIDTLLLVSFSQAKNNSATFEEYVKELQEIKAFAYKIGIANEMPITIAYINGLVKGQFVEKGIDFYRIIFISLERTPVPLRSIVNILALVQKYVSIESSVGFLVYRLIGLVADRSVDVIPSLVPRIEIDFSVDFLVYLFRGSKVSDLEENLYEFLRCRPVIGTLLQIIESSLQSSNNVSLKEIFASPRFRKYRCLIIKTLEKVIKDIEDEGQGSGEDAGQSKNNHNGLFGKRFELQNKQHKEKHMRFGASQRRKNEHHRERHET